MPWRGHAGKNCATCGRHVSECGELSNRYKCQDCARTRSDANLEQLVYHRGPFFDHWLARCRAAFGIPTVDEPHSGA